MKVLYQIDDYRVLFNTLEECEESLKKTYSFMPEMELKCHEKNVLGDTFYFVFWDDKPRMMYHVRALRMAEGAERLVKEDSIQNR